MALIILKLRPIHLSSFLIEINPMRIPYLKWRGRYLNNWNCFPPQLSWSLNTLKEWIVFDLNELVDTFALNYICIYLLQHVLGCFGVDRCMFGSDWPVCTLAKADYKRVFDLLQHLLSSMTVEDKKKIFRENAAKFYKLDLN